MYETYWGLNEPPFSLTPDPRFLYLSRQHQEALSMLQYAIERNKGVALLSGEMGLGKTTVCRRFLASLDPIENRVVNIVDPNMTPVQILREILDQLGELIDSNDRQQLSSRLHRVGHEFYNRGSRIVVLVDEAHLIRSEQTFEELRLLLNCTINDSFPISLVLVGQPELRDILANVPALDQRIAIRQTLQPLDVRDVELLIWHRLRTAGYVSDTNPFSPDAIYLMHRYSGGIPRLVTQLADSVLLSAYFCKQKVADSFLMHSVICDQSGAGVLIKEKISA